MKNKEIINLFNLLQNCGNLKGVKLSYAIVKNNKTLQGAIEAINTALENLKKRHAEKDKDGNPVLKTDKDKDGKELQVYDIKDIKAFQKDYEELMNIETELSLHKVKKEDLPENITPMEMLAIIEFLEEVEA